MEKRELAVYLYLGILIVAAILAIYFFNIPLTGFAVFQQNTQSAFNEGSYQNLEHNGDAVILSANQTNGTYTSKIFDSGNSSVLNNLTWTGTGTFNFEVRNCISSDCSDANFSVPGDLNNLNLTGQYFQYKVLFNNVSTNESLSLTSVSLGYSVLAAPEPEILTITISEPSGTKNSASGIPMEFEITGGAPTACWYNLRDASDNALITSNVVSLADCTNVSFDVGTGEGDYIFTLFVEGSSGIYNKTSDFSISLPSTGTEDEEDETTTEIESTTQIPVQSTPQVPVQVTDLSLQAIEKTTLNPSDSKNFNLVTNNIGNVPLSACGLSTGGNYESWLSVPESSQNINAGETKNFAFSMNVPGDTEEGNYVFPLSVQCIETIKNSEFSVDIVKKKIDFNITTVERTRTDRVVVSYSLKELLNEKQTVDLKFFLYDAGNAEVGNASVNQTLSAGGSKDFTTNIAINKSLEGNLTLSANLNAEQYSVSVKKPITLTTPTGFFALGENLGTTGNVLAIVILLAVIVGIFFLVKGKKFFKKSSSVQ